MLEILSKSSSLILMGSATFLFFTYAFTSRKWYRSATGRVLMTLMFSVALGLGISPYIHIDAVRWILTILKLTIATILVLVGIAIERDQVAYHRKKHTNEDQDA